MISTQPLRKISSTFILLLFTILLNSCSTPTSELSDKPAEREKPTKPLYTLDLHLWHRRTTTSATWRKIQNHDTVHFAKHGLIPMFRLLSVDLKPLNSTYQFDIYNALLKTYCKDSLIETNTQRRFGNDFNSIYSGKEGLLECTDYEILSFDVTYRKVNDTINPSWVDRVEYRIVLDGEEPGEPL